MSHILTPVTKSAEMRILTIVSTLTRGGTERAAVNYTLGYQSQGMACAVLAYSGGGPRKATLDERAIPVFVGGDDAAAQTQAVEQARAWAPDILHLHRPGLPDSLSASILASLRHPALRVIETNVFAYVDDSEDRKLFDLHLLLSRWCLKKWVNGSRGLKDRAAGVVIPYSVDCTSFAPSSEEQKLSFRSELGIPVDAFVYGRVGQPVEVKWSPLLLRSFCEVAERYADAHLVLVGLPPELQRQFKLLPEKVRARVHQLPIVNTDVELQRYYGTMDVFVHAADKGESFGMVLCEAMLCGLPVITLSTPLRDNSQIEVVRNGEAGIVVSDQCGFTAAMNALHEDATLRENISRHAPEHVRRNYDIPVVASALVELARLALSASSSADLNARTARDPRYISTSGAEDYRTMLHSAGVSSSATDALLLSAVNRPLARKAIRLARLAQQKIHKLRS
jgi:glycosyltransferase involved in cell wall biosynthesis